MDDEPTELLEAQVAELDPPSASDRAWRPGGRVPPHNLDAERALLGALLLSRDAVAAAAAVVPGADVFYRPAHAHIYEAITALARGGEVADPITVADELRRRDLLESAGGTAALVELQADAPGTANAAHYARIVRDHSLLRRLIGAAGTIAETAYGMPEDVDALANEAAALVEEVRANGGRLDRLPGYGMADLLDTDLSLSWLVQGLLCDSTYGQIAGEMKTLKSTLATILAVSVASGVPYLGRFPVDRPRPATVLVGEGGRVPFVRRLTAICRAMEIPDPRELPIRAMFEVATIGSERFRGTLDDELDRGAGLVIVDPLYAFHGTSVNSANLHEEGSLLTSLSNPCTEAGATLLVVNHFNQTGAGSGLKRITQAGSGEWVDSWMLTRHRKDPDVANGDFHLELQVGSRQWGGSTWDLDMHLGRLDLTTGQHTGEPTWEARPVDRTARDTEASDETRQRILATATEHPGLSREELAKATGGRITAARKLVDRMDDEGALDRRYDQYQRSDGRTAKRWAYYAPSHPGTVQDGPHTP